MVEEPTVAIALILGTGMAAQWLAWRLGIPSILLLLVTGLVLGPGTGTLHPDEVFGPLLFPAVSIAVAVILFEGGMSLSIRELRGTGHAVRALISVGTLVTWAIGAVAAHLFLSMDWDVAVLLGAILVVTGPTVIGPLLRHIRPTGRAASVLKWEGILIDPIGAMLAVLVFEATLAGNARVAANIFTQGLLQTIGSGLGIGIGAAALMVVLLRRYLIPDPLHGALALALVVGAFVAANHLQEESGLLAVTVMGIALASQRIVPVRHILEFEENLRTLLLSALFVTLAARLTRADISMLGIGSIAFVAVLIIVARPMSVFISTARTKLTWQERTFVAWMAPRGIVAAAVSTLFALRFEEGQNVPARLLVPATFAVIIGTIVVYGGTGPWLARKLGISDVRPGGMLIVGAHAWARTLAKTLQSKNVKVLLIDTEYGNVAAARLAGLPVFYGSVLSEDTLTDMDFGGIGSVLAATPNDEVNALAVQTLAPVVGRRNVYQVATKDGAERKRHALAPHLRGRILGNASLTYGVLADRITKGATFKATKLSKTFDLDSFHREHGENAVPLGTIDGGTLTVFATDDKKTPRSGQLLLALIPQPHTATL